MKLGAIDIGSNSIHLLIVEFGVDGQPHIIEKLRDQTQLAENMSSGEISPRAFARGVETLRSYVEVANKAGVDDLISAATSAVREAKNGNAFCSEVREKTGHRVRVISGLEEARLVALGVRLDLDASDLPSLLVDLGGGSLELAILEPSGVRDVMTLPLGHLRLTDAFCPDSPASEKAVEALRAHVRDTLKAVEHWSGGTKSIRCTGTGGSIRTLGRIEYSTHTEQEPTQDHGLTLTSDFLTQFAERYASGKRDSLVRLAGMDARRKRTLPVAALVLAELFEVLNVPQLITSGRSLRDGLIADWMSRNRPFLDPQTSTTSRRERTIHAVMDRYRAKRPHALHVAHLATCLFDQTAAAHGLGEGHRKLLRWSAMVHDIGHHVAGQDHHKHGAYLLKHHKMYGFTQDESLMLALLVRYHRGSGPKKSHPDVKALSSKERRALKFMSGLLRIADNLDRSHDQSTRSVSARCESEQITITVTLDRFSPIEQWTTERNLPYLERMLGRSLDIEYRIEHNEQT